MNIAIITGASSGLGREYARQLAQDDSIEEFWLVARREERLTALKEELAPKACRLFPLDLTEPDSFTRIEKQLAANTGLEVRGLINAAGFGRIGSCSEIDTATTAHLIDLNCRAAVTLTQLALPFMSAGSHILEICSCAAFQPIPFLTAYAASKAFLLSYSRALGQELAPQHIDVTAVCPYWIKDTEFITEARKTDRQGLFHSLPLASTQAEIAERSLRAARNHIKVCTPDAISFLHRIFASILPHSLLIQASELYRRLR